MIYIIKNYHYIIFKDNTWNSSWWASNFFVYSPNSVYNRELGYVNMFIKLPVGGFISNTFPYFYSLIRRLSVISSTSTYLWWFCILSVTLYLVVESHPDNTHGDLRLDRPFPALIEYVDSMDLEGMTSQVGWSKEISGIPNGRIFPFSFSEIKKTFVWKQIDWIQEVMGVCALLKFNNKLYK